jgi:recombination protein RecA
MAVVISKKKKPMAKEIGANGKSVADVLAAHQKDKGDSIGSFGGHPMQVTRLPTGLLPFDLATGGGLPRGRCTIVYGPESSCLTGDVFIQFEVRTVGGKRQNHKGGTLEHLYRRFNGLPRKGKGAYQRKVTVGSEFWAPCLNEEGRIEQRRIMDVVHNGVKPVFLLKTKMGFEITATADHRFHAGDRYLRLDQLEVGSTVMVHNNTPYTVGKQQKKSRPTVNVKHHPFGAWHAVNKCKYVGRSRLEYEAHMNGLPFEAYRNRLNAGNLNGLEFLSPDMHVHHKDEDFTNNAFENLELLHESDHGRLHALERHNNLRFMAVEDEVVSITPAGEQDVYDVEMEDPYPNFVANGFVVHNCKTNLAFKAIAMNQLLHPEEINVYIAIEPFDGPWAEKMGVDISKLAVLYPSYAEQAVDMAEDMLRTDDCGVVVLDSLAAMITTQEAGKSAEQATVGGSSMPVGALVRRTTLALNDAEKAGRSPTLIYINQTRYKVGFVMGDPEIMPGGQAPKFQAALWVRVYGKNIMDSAVSSDFPVRKEVSFVIKKNKCPIISNSGKFEMVMYPHDGLKIGATADYNTVTEYLKMMGLFDKEKKGYTIGGKHYPTLKAFEDRLYMDAAFGNMIRQSITEYVLGLHDSKLIIQDGTSVDADGVVSEQDQEAEDA